jgi:hypothetical protein
MRRGLPWTSRSSKWLRIRLATGLERQAKMARKAAEVRAVVITDDAVRVGNALDAAGLVLFRLVGASAVVGVESDAFVVVAGDGGNAAFTDHGDDFIRPGVVADEIAEAVDLVGQRVRRRRRGRLRGREGWRGCRR